MQKQQAALSARAHEATGGYYAPAEDTVAQDTHLLEDALRLFLNELEQQQRFQAERDVLRDVLRDVRSLQARLQRGY